MLRSTKAKRACCLPPSGVTGDNPTFDAFLFPRDPQGCKACRFFRMFHRQKGRSLGSRYGDIVDTLGIPRGPQVVETRWQIDSASAVPMMDAFTWLGERLTVSLRRSRSATIPSSAMPDTKHPYYWRRITPPVWEQPICARSFMGKQATSTPAALRN